MNKQLFVHFLPELITPEGLRGATVVVIDVLRATTTINFALAAGAKEVVPCLDLDHVRSAGKSLVREEVVLGGERFGEKIDLFDLGNSPTEYTPEVVTDKTILFTTTNGTKAMGQAREAHRVLIGAAVNVAAICTAIADTLNVHLLCAGTDGQVTREDILVAGAIVYQLTKHEATAPVADDGALVARAAWRAVMASALGAGESIPQRLAKEFRATRGGRNLLALGMEQDLISAAELDRFDFAPELDLEMWRIVRPQ